LNTGLVFLVLAASLPSMAKAPPAPPGPPRAASQHATIVPVADAPGRYLLQQRRATTLFNEQGLTLRLTPAIGPARQLQWGVASARAVSPQPLQPQQARVSQLVGSPEHWRQGLSTWGALYYPAVAPGVDLWFEAREGGVQYSLRAERGADLRQVRLEWRGAQELRLLNGGQSLAVKLAEGELREEGLRCGQEAADGSSREVPCRYREVRSRGTDLWEYVIEVDVREPGLPAWVDPVIQWNTFVGGQGNDALEHITVLNGGPGSSITGQFFVVGTSGGNGLESMAPEFTGIRFLLNSTAPDVVVSRRSPTGPVIWTSILGGSGVDIGRAFAVGANGDVFVAGSTTSTDLGAGPNGEQHVGGKDGFIARISSDGSVLEWIQYIAGPGDEEIYSLTRGQDGKLYAAGSTRSAQLSGADGGLARGGLDLFVSRIDAVSGAVERTLVRGGSRDEEAFSIANGEDAGTRALLYVTGYTESPDFPLDAPPATPNSETAGGREAVVLKLNDQLASPEWATFIGGNPGPDEGRAVLYLAETNRLMVVGTTRASNFPRLHATGTSPPGANAFLAAFNPTNGASTFSATVGGGGDDEGLALTTGSFGSLYIGGRTASADLPVPFGFDARAQLTEGYVLRLSPEPADAGFVQEWGTYVGGSQDDDVRALGAPASNEVLLIGGMTGSSEMMPHQLRPIDSARDGGEDMFLISMNAVDLTPPLGVVYDGRTGDTSTVMESREASANWKFTERESSIMSYEFGLGTVPGCDDIVNFRSASRNEDITLLADLNEMPELERGRWYFSIVRAKNRLELTNTVSSNGYFVTLTDGGPSLRPNRPDASVPCSRPQPDGGTDGGTGQSDGGAAGPQSPVGFSCGCGATGGPTGLLLLMLVAFGLRAARRADQA
jgi:hypothetical protein